MSQPRLIRKIWEVGAEQPARVGTAPSSNSSEEGWRQSRAGALKHASRPVLPEAFLPSPERVAKQGINGPMQGEGLASPLQLWEGTGGSGAAT